MYKQALDDNSAVKYAFFISDSFHASLNATFKRSLPIMQNDRVVRSLQLLTFRNNPLLLDIDELFKKWIPSGIVQHLLDYGKWFIDRPIEDTILDNRRILSMFDLEYGFVLWLIACGISTIVFICEMIPVWIGLMKKILQKLMVIINFIIALRIFLRNHHHE